MTFSLLSSSLNGSTLKEKNLLPKTGAITKGRKTILIPHLLRGIMVSHWLCVCPSVRPSIFSFLDDLLSKCLWTFTKLGVCIEIVEIWFEIVNGQILSFLYPATR